MLFLALACIAVLGTLLIWQFYSSAKERAETQASFTREREAWVRERRDLNNRIQIPQAAPYLAAEDDPEAGKDDLPTLPEFSIDEVEMEEAKRELEKVGYEEGPAL